MKLIIGSDHLGYDFKEIIKEFIKKEFHIDCEDVGVYNKEPVDYPDIAFQLTDKIRKGLYDRGILICGTGAGMAIAANKVHGIYAAVCHDPYTAERAMKSNNTNVMALGALVIGIETAKHMVRIWLSSQFQGGLSTRKVGKIITQEREFLTAR